MKWIFIRRRKIAQVNRIRLRHGKCSSQLCVIVVHNLFVFLVDIVKHFARKRKSKCLHKQRILYFHKYLTMTQSVRGIRFFFSDLNAFTLSLVGAQMKTNVTIFIYLFGAIGHEIEINFYPQRIWTNIRFDVIWISPSCTTNTITIRSIRFDWMIAITMDLTLFRKKRNKKKWSEMKWVYWARKILVAHGELLLFDWKALTLVFVHIRVSSISTMQYLLWCATVGIPYLPL